MQFLTSIVFALVAIASTSAVHAADTCGTVMPNTGVYGDLIESIDVQDISQCCAKCTANQDCVTYVTFGGWRGASPSCNLYRKVFSTFSSGSGGPQYTTVAMNDRGVPAWGKCGDSSGFNFCSSGFYCQPWDKNFYQCIQKPATCEVETNFDYYGNDLKTVAGITPGDCCTECSKTSGCVAYTFVNDDPDGKTKCYLKTSASGRTGKTGVFSGKVANTPAWEKCGDSQGFKPCVDGYYCQPWDATYYQCVAYPSSCYNIETNIDYVGHDIKRVTGLLPNQCCEECAKTTGCVAYTFVNDDPDGHQCYLKSSAEGRTIKVGAFSGRTFGMMS